VLAIFIAHGSPCVGRYDLWQMIWFYIMIIYLLIEIQTKY